MDGRLWICFVAVAVAGGALAYDFLNPFPASRYLDFYLHRHVSFIHGIYVFILLFLLFDRPVLVGCVATYFFLMAVLTLYTTYKEKGIFVVALQKDPAGLDPPCIWEASSNMKK